ncbi:hypothetical protein [Nocardia macrotermitis]|uniref:Uncharacterized protein n=1 Tax=Nocardia macrotermitis TaxID=2585198 RepID=A0A7K0DFT9_9NOCA|nr:hypothetical protein [Nocardia macrotermitis]MQY23644.1 hypothetical protein [Nocardia macrotermitis]
MGFWGSLCKGLVTAAAAAVPLVLMSNPIGIGAILLGGACAAVAGGGFSIGQGLLADGSINWGNVGKSALISGLGGLAGGGAGALLRGVIPAGASLVSAVTPSIARGVGTVAGAGLGGYFSPDGGNPLPNLGQVPTRLAGSPNATSTAFGSNDTQDKLKYDKYGLAQYPTSGKVKIKLDNGDTVTA